MKSGSVAISFIIFIYWRVAVYWDSRVYIQRLLGYHEEMVPWPMCPPWECFLSLRRRHAVTITCYKTGTIQIQGTVCQQSVWHHNTEFYKQQAKEVYTIKIPLGSLMRIYVWYYNAIWGFCVWNRIPILRNDSWHTFSCRSECSTCIMKLTLTGRWRREHMMCYMCMRRILPNAPEIMLLHDIYVYRYINISHDWYPPRPI